MSCFSAAMCQSDVNKYLREGWGGAFFLFLLIITHKYNTLKLVFPEEDASEV